jgi:hypothetical protein
MNMRNGQRVSTNDAYLEPARSRPNLTIVGDALVDHVELDGRRARGVRVLTGEGWHVIDGRDVILCAGAIDSPAILPRSGIGPADDLRRVGVAPLVNAPASDRISGSIRSSCSRCSSGQTPSQRPSTRGSPCVPRALQFRTCGCPRNDMQILSVQPVGVDEDANVRGWLAVSMVTS